MLARIGGVSKWTVPGTYFAGGEKKHFLFEGSGSGKGALVLRVKRGNQVVAETTTWVELRDITQMYERALIDSISDSVPNPLVPRFVLQSPLPISADETKHLIINVHGWNNTPWRSESYAQTMFKRLYWQGYRGHYLALRWPTKVDITTYNTSEHKAFYAGDALAALLVRLRERFADHSINVAAHSMGNIVMMQALKRLADLNLQPIDNYVMMEAAVPAQCYDSNAPPHVLLFQAEAVSPTPDAYMSYLPATNLVRGSIINFFSEDDFALNLWIFNQTTKKPDGDYNYETDGISGFRNEIPMRVIDDPRELLPFVCRPRTRAVGAEELTWGVVNGRLNLKTTFGFDQRPGDHSGQYTRAIQDIGPFYLELLDAFQVLP